MNRSNQGLMLQFRLVFSVTSTPYNLRYVAIWPSWDEKLTNLYLY